MARFGAFCFPAAGHLNPMTALAFALQQRGHEVVIFGIADVEAIVRGAEVEYARIGEQDYPPGTLQVLDEQLAKLKGIAAFRFTLERVRNSMRLALRDGPEAVRNANVDVLLVDEAEFAGNVADHLCLRWISIALIPPLLSDDRFPPFWLGWAGSQNWLSRLRNRVAIHLLLRFATPIFKEINLQRSLWRLKPLKEPEDGLSPLAQITQLPRALEFEIHGEIPKGLHYTGLFLNAKQRPTVAFPWERLDGPPLIYASLGTLQNGSEAIFQTIVRACAGCHAQLVLSLGGGLDPAALGPLVGDPVVVRFAPQLEILKRAALVITHAGLNTVLEALSEGVPMVAIPLANDQPGVAARLKARGACVVVSRNRLSPARLHDAVLLVLNEAKYRKAAQALQQSMKSLDGPSRAADIIEEVLNLRSAVRHNESPQM